MGATGDSGGVGCVHRDGVFRVNRYDYFALGATVIVLLALLAKGVW